jgi:hypothetical protein
MATATERRHLVRLASFLSAKAELVNWAEVRPMSTAHLTESQLRDRLDAGKTITTDCSETVTLMFRLAGLQDPNGLRYDGYGYTGDMLEHLEHFTDWGKVHPGTLIVFGDYPGVHVVMVTEPAGSDPLVYSHGSHARSAIWSLNTERSYHPNIPFRLLAIADL